LPNVICWGEVIEDVVDNPGLEGTLLDPSHPDSVRARAATKKAEITVSFMKTLRLIPLTSSDYDRCNEYRKRNGYSCRMKEHNHANVRN
jgi:hypothetical protein